MLGPTAMGRIPGFTSHIFPPASIPSLNLLSTLGLSLFLFVIGLEVDFGLFKRNLVPCLGELQWRLSLSITPPGRKSAL